MHKDSLENAATRQPDLSARIISSHGHHESLQYDFKDFFLLESGTDLEHLFDYWSQQEGAVPTHFSPEIDLPLFSGAVTACIGVSSPDPMEFWPKEHRVCQETGRGTGLSGQPAKGHPWRQYAAAVTTEYNFCRHSGMPEYSEIHQSIGGIESHFTRLLLPVSRDPNGNVTDLYACIRHLRQNKRVKE